MKVSCNGYECAVCAAWEEDPDGFMLLRLHKFTEEDAVNCLVLKKELTDCLVCSPDCAMEAMRRALMKYERTQ